MASTLPAQKAQTFLLGIYLPLPLTPPRSLSFVARLIGFGILFKTLLLDIYPLNPSC
jgi:hypothetical protein